MIYKTPNAVSFLHSKAAFDAAFDEFSQYIR